MYVEPIFQQLINETTQQKPTLKRVVVASGNKIAIGNTLGEALANLLSKSAGNINITNTDSIEGLVKEIIKANDNVKNSSKNYDWKLFGEDMQTLTNLIDQLGNLVSETKNDKSNVINNETANTIE